jgi:hypothetical protein
MTVKVYPDCLFDVFGIGLRSHSGDHFPPGHFTSPSADMKQGIQQRTFDGFPFGFNMDMTGRQSCGATGRESGDN